MRILLIAVLLAFLPGTAPAQQPSALQQVGTWTRELAAAQQPIVDASRGCSATMEQAQAAMQAGSQERMRALLMGSAFRTCVERIRTAGGTARDNLNRMGPMPAEMERMLNIDSRDLLRRAATSIDGMVGYNDKIRDALDAFATGDAELAMQRLEESRALAGSVMDGEILLLETIRASVPLQTHKSMMDVRLSITRATRILSVTDPASDSDAAALALRAEGNGARSAAQQMRANWARESVELRRLTARLGNPRNNAVLATLDECFERIASAGDQIGASLEAFPVGRLQGADVIGAMRLLSEMEIVVVQTAQRSAIAASQIG